MRRTIRIAFATAALAFAGAATPAQAALVLVATLSGPQCTAGPITACFASGTTAGTGALSNAVGALGSPGILRLEGTGTLGHFTDNLAGSVLSFNYSPVGADPIAHYIGLFNGGGAASGPGTTFNNTYQLFYSADPITTGTLDLSLYFHNPGISHVDLFDTGAIPEPATWAMMLLGFVGIGTAMRRLRKSRRILQVA